MVFKIPQKIILKKSFSIFGVNTFERVNKVKIAYSFPDRKEGYAAIVVADNSLA